MMMGNHFLKQVPFLKVYVHALVRDEKGQKMSKSKGNVIDPLNIINKYGADSLRLTLISMAAPGRDVKLSEDRVKGYRNFLNKIWNANKFLDLNSCKVNDKIKIKGINLDVNKWIYFELVKTSIDVQKNISIFRFDEASKILYKFVWHTYCDWYLEFLKPIFDSNNRENLEESRNTASFIQYNILTMLHPFIPFFTEKLWLDLKLNKKLKTPLMEKDWNLPFKPDVTFEKSYEKIDWIIKLITIIRVTKVDLEVSPGDFIDISIDELDARKKTIIKDNLSVFKRLGRITNVNEKKLDKKGINIVFGVETVTLYFGDSINLSNQKLKLEGKLRELENKVTNLTNKLNNESFLENAPKSIVQREKKSLINNKVELKKLNSILNSINN